MVSIRNTFSACAIILGESKETMRLKRNESDCRPNLPNISNIYEYLLIGDFRMSAGRVTFHFPSAFNTYILPNTASENPQRDRCPTKLRIDHSKLTHGHYM